MKGLSVYLWGYLFIHLCGFGYKFVTFLSFPLGMFPPQPPSPKLVGIGHTHSHYHPSTLGVLVGSLACLHPGWR